MPLVSTTPTACPCCCPPATLSCRKAGGTACLCGFSEYAGHISNPPILFQHKVKSGTMTLRRSVDNNCGTPDCVDVTTLVGRHRGGTYAMCGWPEFGTPSIPWKSYRHCEVNGFWATCNWNAAGCTGNVCATNCHDKMVYSGSCNFPATGAGCPYTNLFERKYGYTGGAPCSTEPTVTHYDYPAWSRPYVPDSGSNGDYPSIFNEIIHSTTSKTWDYTNGKWTPCTKAGSLWRTWLGAVNWVTSVEETEDSSIARLLANAPGATWSSYDSPLTSTALARWEPRTASFSGIYQEAQFSFTKTGLTPLKTYHVKYVLMRRVFGVGSYVSAGTIVLSGTTDGSGVLSLADQPVPNVRGYETYPANPCVLLDDDIVDTWNYAQDYSPTTCVLGAASDTSTRTVDGVTDPAGPNEADYGIGAAVTETLTNHTRTLTGNGTCVYAPRYTGDAFPWVEATGTVTETLSDADTEEAAINRAWAGWTWGSWHEVTINGGACDNPACCLAYWTVRGPSDTCFAVQEAQWKATRTGLTPGAAFRAKVKIYRAPVGTSSWMLYATIISTGTVDGTGKFEKTGDVPNESGYQTYAQSACAEPDV
jgi:hypothetical protein